MPTEVSLVAGASSLTTSARRALRAARATEGSRLSEEGNAARVDRALDALDYAAGVLDAIVGHAPDPDADAPVWSRRQQGAAAAAAGPVRHEAEELHASLMALARTRAPVH